MRDAVINCGGPPRCGTCRACREAAALDHVGPLPVQPAHLMPAFSLFDNPRRRGETYRNREVDRLLAAIGLRPRNR
jgi:hypothetical protein